jgi:hypothetical protein
MNNKNPSIPITPTSELLANKGPVVHAASESVVRGRARSARYAVHKSRARMHANNLGEYMLTKVDGNYVVLGANYNASLADIEAYLAGSA